MGNPQRQNRTPVQKYLEMLDLSKRAYIIEELERSTGDSSQEYFLVVLEGANNLTKNRLLTRH